MSKQVYPGAPELGIPALYLHDLTGTPEAERLLSNPPTVHPESQNVLPRLRAWAPDVAALFSPATTRKKDIPFRLLSQTPMWKAGETPGFVAVSYCWHSDEWQLAPALRRRVSSNDVRLPISELMLSSIIQQLPSIGTGIWIDQFCIDQTNVGEKKHAIEQMDSIFHNATRVFILLEDLDLSQPAHDTLYRLLPSGRGLQHHHLRASDGRLDRCPVFELIRDHDDLKPFEEKCRHSNGIAMADFIAAFCKSRWLTRAWCKQEFLLNRSCIFLLSSSQHGVFSIPPLAFIDLRAALFNAPYSEQAIELSQNDFFIAVSPMHYRPLHAFQFFSDLRRLQCSVITDKIVIAMNTVGLPLSMYTNAVTPTMTVEYVLSTLALALGDASVLGIGSLHLRSRVKQLEHRTWHTQRGSPGSAPNWQCHVETRFATEGALPVIVDNNSITRVGEHSIVLGLFSLRHRPERIPRKDLDRAVEFIEILRGGHHGSLPMLPHPGHTGNACDDHEFLDRHCVALLSVLGRHWSIRSSVDLSLLGLSTFRQKAKAKFVPAAKAALSTFVGVYEDSPDFIRLRDSMGQYLYFCFCLPIFLPLHDFDIFSWYATILRVGKGAAEYGLLLLPASVDFGVFDSLNDVSIVIPAALNTVHGTALQRVWLLRSTERDHVKSCFARGFLFACDSVMESAGYVDYHNSVEVVGSPLTDEDRTAANSFDVQTLLLGSGVTTS